MQEIIKEQLDKIRVNYFTALFLMNTIIKDSNIFNCTKITENYVLYFIVKLRSIFIVIGDIMAAIG